MRSVISAINSVLNGWSWETPNYAIVLSIFLDFICGPKFSKMEGATFGILLLNLKFYGLVMGFFAIG